MRMTDSERILKNTADMTTDDAPVLVNVTRMTRDKYFEAVRARGKYTRSRFFVLGGIVIAVLGLLMASPVVAVLGVVISLLTIVSPYAIGRRDYRRLEAIHPHGEWVKTVRFFPDRVETDSGEGQIRSAPYRSIKTEFETEHMYILEFGKEIPATTFDKDSFVQGSLDELKAFLTEARRSGYSDEEDNNVD